MYFKRKNRFLENISVKIFLSQKIHRKKSFENILYFFLFRIRRETISWNEVIFYEKISPEKEWNQIIS